MPMYDFICHGCSQEFETLVKIGEEFATCPACGATGDRTRKGSLASAAVIGDEIPGGVWLENYGPDPVKVYSHTERRALMKCCVDRKGRPYQLTEIGNDFHGGCAITREGLEAARLLVERVTSMPLTGRDAEQADRDFRDPAVREFNHADGNAAAIAAQVFKLDRDQR